MPKATHRARQGWGDRSPQSLGPELFPPCCGETVSIILGLPGGQTGLRPCSLASTCGLVRALIYTVEKSQQATISGQKVPRGTAHHKKACSLLKGWSRDREGTTLHGLWLQPLCPQQASGGLIPSPVPHLPLPHPQNCLQITLWASPPPPQTLCPLRARLRVLHLPSPHTGKRVTGKVFFRREN